MKVINPFSHTTDAELTPDAVPVTHDGDETVCVVEATAPSLVVLCVNVTSAFSGAMTRYSQVVSSHSWYCTVVSLVSFSRGDSMKRNSK